MNELQQKLLTMLNWFHNVCEKENLQYYALGGTALGAIRHNGFIPWDDDIDVGMPRDDYNKLREICSKYNAGQYYIEFPGTNDDFVYPFCKVYDKQTTLVENVKGHIKRGIYLDVFPLDGIGNTLNDAIDNYKSINRKIDFLNTRICEIRKGRSWYKNLAIILSKAVPEFLCNTHKLIENINSDAQKNKYSSCDFVVNLFGQWKEKEITKREWFGVPTLRKFETGVIYCPQNPHEYLTDIYGDYMQLPPVDKRISHHDYIYMSLNEPYMD